MTESLTAELWNGITGIYEVGRELLRRGSPNPQYQKWIDTYADDQYGDVVRSVLDVADGLGPVARAGRARPGRAALPDHVAVQVDVLGRRWSRRLDM